MALLKKSITSLIMRNASTNKASLTSSDAISVNEKERYYQKIGRTNVNINSYVKPQDWDKAKPFENIPGPKPIPLFGNMWRFIPGGEFYNVQLIDLHKILQKKYGNLTHFTGIFGQRPLLFAYDPDDIEQTLRNEGPWPIRYGLPSFAYYRNHIRHDVFQGVGGLLTVQNEEWFSFRSIVNKILMQPRTSETFVDSMDEVANDFIENIRNFAKSDPKNEMPEKFQNEIYKWTLESMGVIAYNTRIGCLYSNSSNNADGLKTINMAIEMFELMYKLDVLPSLWRWISTRNWRRYVDILNHMTEFNQKHIEQCLSNSDPNPNKPDYERSVLERLAKVDKKVALSMATDMIIAGIDTTGRTMGSALYFLARNPQVQEILRKELREWMPNKDSPVSKEMLRDFPYLKAVVKETTRLSPISVGTLRTTVKDTILSGYRVPKGTDVLAINIIPSTDEKYFKRANEFLPERWLRTNDTELSHKNVHSFTFLPFGFGPRSCIGKRLANLELEVGIAKVIRNFKLSWHYPDARFGTHLLYGIIDPIKIKVEEMHY